MSQSAEPTTERLVWEDEFWVLRADDPTDEMPVALTLRARDPEGLGRLDDDQASQLGRIANRLIRIVEHLPGTGRVELGRSPQGSFGVWFRAGAGDDGVLDDDHLHLIATKLANWGGDART